MKSDFVKMRCLRALQAQRPPLFVIGRDAIVRGHDQDWRIICNKALSSSAKVTWFAIRLMDHVWHEPTCGFPTVGNVVEMTGLSTPSVEVAFWELERAGYIRWHPELRRAVLCWLGRPKKNRPLSDFWAEHKQGLPEPDV
jgi:hypothetical protein